MKQTALLALMMLALLCSCERKRDDYRPEWFYGTIEEEEDTLARDTGSAALPQPGKSMPEERRSTGKEVTGTLEGHQAYQSSRSCDDEEEDDEEQADEHPGTKPDDPMFGYDYWDDEDDAYEMDRNQSDPYPDDW